MSLIAELKRRKVFRAAGAYAVVGWLVIEVAATIAPQLNFPEWVPRLITFAILLGFPVALVMAWVFDVTPEGIRVDASKTGSKRVFVVAGVLIAFTLGWYFHDRLQFGKDEETAPSAVVTSAETAAPAALGKSIAVLPFENLSGDADNAYFVSGMQDLILTNLSKIRDLKVISRTSTEKYASRPDNLKIVGAELGVATILEGSVQRAGDSVLINLQLIDVNTDAHLWAEVYNRKIEDVFAVEQEVAKTVAEALKATLSPSEAAAIADKPTEDSAAYDLFLRAEYLSHQGSQNGDGAAMSQSVALYRQAIAKDPKFALAHAQLSITLSDLYWNGGTPDLSQQLLAQQSRAAMVEAKRLQPDLAFLKYRVDLDFPAAVAAFDAVLSVRPGDAYAWLGKAWPLRRLGRFDEAIAAMKTAVAISPRDSYLMSELARTYGMVRRLAEEEEGLRRSLALDPDNLVAQTNLSQFMVYRNGDFAGAWEVLRGDQPSLVFQRAELLRMQRKTAEALGLLEQLSDSEVSFLGWGRPKTMLVGGLYFEAGENSKAAPLLRQAKAELEARLKTLAANYGNGQALRLSLAETEAMLGDEAAALRTTQQALLQLPVEKDAVNGADTLALAAQVYARLGRVDLVMPLLERVRLGSGADSLISASTLRLDPVWDKVRDDSRFQTEVKRFAEFDQP
jgi:TolB-like protein/Tfp pilus assembly protein PilF